MAHLEHIGIAVDEVEALIECLDEVLHERPYKAETVSRQQVRTHFLDAGTAKLELLESLDPDSAVGRFLNRHGEGLHHLAFEVADLDASMDRLRHSDFTFLDETPQEGADEKRICFLHPKETHGVLIELCENQTPNWSPEHLSHRNGTLAVYERGNQSARTLLMLHGAGGSTTQDLVPLMRRLEPSFHLLALDFSGHGSSSFPPSEPLQFQHFVDDVERVLRERKEHGVHLFGFSLGSAVALRIAAAHPDRIRRLSLFAPIPEWTPSLVEKMRTRLNVRTLRERHPQRAERLETEHSDAARLFSSLRSFVETLPEHNARMEDILRQVSVPTLVVGLDADPLAPVEKTKKVYRILSDARFCVLPGTRHRVSSHEDLLSPLLDRHFS